MNSLLRTNDNNILSAANKNRILQPRFHNTWDVCVSHQFWRFLLFTATSRLLVLRHKSDISGGSLPTKADRASVCLSASQRGAPLVVTDMFSHRLIDRLIDQYVSRFARWRSNENRFFAGFWDK